MITPSVFSPTAKIHLPQRGRPTGTSSPRRSRQRRLPLRGSCRDDIRFAKSARLRESPSQMAQETPSVFSPTAKIHLPQRGRLKAVAAALPPLVQRPISPDSGGKCLLGWLVVSTYHSFVCHPLRMALPFSRNSREELIDKRGAVSWRAKVSAQRADGGIVAATAA